MLVCCVDDGVLTIPVRGIAIVLPPLRSLPLCSPRARSLALDLNRIAPGSPPAQSMLQGTRSLSMNGAGDDRVGSARHQRYRRLVPVTTINRAGISRDPQGRGPIFPNEANRLPRCLLSRRSPRGQRCGCAREQPRGRVRHRRQVRGPPPPDLGVSLNWPAHRPRPDRSVLCRWEGRPQRGVWITRCGARIAKRNTSQDVQCDPRSRN